jgi:tRNA A37 threonylcarbamoyladenosine modification protein TsaB
LDAQRQELFVAKFEPGWQDRSGDLPETRILGVEQWVQELVPGDVVCGPPLQKLVDRLPAGVSVVDEESWKPQAEAAGRLGIASYQSGQLVDAMQLVPRYFRKSAAEEKAERQI